MKKLMIVVVILLLLLVIGTTILFLNLKKVIDPVEPNPEVTGEVEISEELEIPEETEISEGLGISAKDFRKDKFEIGKKRFEDVMAYDLDNKYPTTPSDVVSKYSEIYNLIYGNIIANEDLIFDLVMLQRKFYSNELLEANTIDDQFADLIIGLNALSEDNFHFIGNKQEEVIYDTEMNTLATVDVLQYSNTVSNFRKTYLLEKDTESKRWLIKSWNIKLENPTLE